MVEEQAYVTGMDSLYAGETIWNFNGVRVATIGTLDLAAMCHFRAPFPLVLTYVGPVLHQSGEMAA